MSASSPILLTLDGLKRLNARLDELERERIAIVQKIDEARKLGDLSENAEYKAARDEQKINEKKLAEASFTKANAQVITKELIGDKNTVKIGARVMLKSTTSNEKKTITIVCNYESDVEHNLISIDTPIAKKMLNKMVDDEVTIGPKTYIIEKISYEHL